MTPGRAAEGRAQRESIAGEKPYRFSGPRSKAIPKRVVYRTRQLGKCQVQSYRWRRRRNLHIAPYE